MDMLVLDAAMLVLLFHLLAVKRPSRGVLKLFHFYFHYCCYTSMFIITVNATATVTMVTIFIITVTRVPTRRT